MKYLLILSMSLITLSSYSLVLKKATFAGGCFWCMEPPFEKLNGVTAVVSGYSDGKIKNPNYGQVSSGKTKYIEVVQVTYDPKIITYEKLLEVFWTNIDPTDSGGQFVDRGYQYTTAIFYHDKKQKELAELSKQYLIDRGIFKKNIVTPIKFLKNFYPAEEYHQDFYKKNEYSIKRYKRYRQGSGRDQFIEKYWKDIKLDFNLKHEKKAYKITNKKKLKQKLTKMQYYVTQENGTERAFKNEYWDHKAEGIYVDIVSNEPLFSSKDKFKSGTGWPSFTQPLVKKHIVEVIDNTHGMKRVEVRSKYANSHLGHVFNDGPAPTYKRYCINSAALRFIKKEDLKKEGFGEFVSLFQKKK